mgnify:FL=1
MEKLGQILKSLWHGPYGRQLKFISVVGACLLVFMTFFADDSVLRWISAKMEIRRQNVQMEQYQKEIREMDKQIKMLSTDRDTLEEFSRERFHFAAPGEDVYVYGDK